MIASPLLTPEVMRFQPGKASNSSLTQYGLIGNVLPAEDCPSNAGVRPRHGMPQQSHSIPGCSITRYHLPVLLSVVLRDLVKVIPFAVYSKIVSQKAMPRSFLSLWQAWCSIMTLYFGRWRLSLRSGLSSIYERSIGSCFMFTYQCGHNQGKWLSTWICSLAVAKARDTMTNTLRKLMPGSTLRCYRCRSAAGTLIPRECWISWQ